MTFDYKEYMNPPNSMNPYGRNNHSSRDTYIMRRYEELFRMAQEITHGHGVYEVTQTLAILEVGLELRELPARMPIPNIPENKLDVRIVSDYINAAMSEMYQR